MYPSLPKYQPTHAISKVTIELRKIRDEWQAAAAELTIYESTIEEITKLRRRPFRRR